VRLCGAVSVDTCAADTCHPAIVPVKYCSCRDSGLRGVSVHFVSRFGDSGRGAAITVPVKEIFRLINTLVQDILSTPGAARQPV
jgi:hypothetical protein